MNTLYPQKNSNKQVQIQWLAAEWAWAKIQKSF
jgi:hypothetical protein